VGDETVSKLSLSANRSQVTFQCLTRRDGIDGWWVVVVVVVVGWHDMTHFLLAALITRPLHTGLSLLL